MPPGRRQRLASPQVAPACSGSVKTTRSPVGTTRWVRRTRQRSPWRGWEACSARRSSTRPGKVQHPGEPREQAHVARPRRYRVPAPSASAAAAPALRRAMDSDRRSRPMPLISRLFATRRPGLTPRDGPRPLRPALRCLRPGAGTHRGRIGEGLHGEVQRLRTTRSSKSAPCDQRGARRAREAPPVGAVDGLLQARARRALPRAARARSGRRPRPPARRRRHPTSPSPTVCLSGIAEIDRIFKETKKA